MRVAHINATCASGSTGTIVNQLRTYAQLQGHEVRVFYGADPDFYNGAIRIGARPGQITHALKSRSTGKQGYASRLATKRLVRALETFGPDLVHLHNLHANYLHVGMLLRYLAQTDIPTVITLHDCWPFTGKCTYPIQTGCVRWMHEGCHDCPQLRTDNVNPTFFFDRTAVCYSDKRLWFGAIPRLGVVGVSDWITEEARRSFLGEKNPVRIYNWIDRSAFCPMPRREVSVLRSWLGVCEGERLVLFASSNLSHRKGYDVLASLPERLDGHSRVVYIGSNREGLPIPETVKAIGPVRNQAELALYYSAADICINTTKCETFGLVTAEALACGTPVVVNPNTASPELVEDGCGHVLSQEDDVEEVAAIIAALPRQKDERTIERCAESSVRFDPETSMSAYLAYYRQVRNGDS